MGAPRSESGLSAHLWKEQAGANGCAPDFPLSRGLERIPALQGSVCSECPLGWSFPPPVFGAFFCCLFGGCLLAPWLWAKLIYAAATQLAGGKQKRFSLSQNGLRSARSPAHSVPGPPWPSKEAPLALISSRRAPREARVGPEMLRVPAARAWNCWNLRKTS